MCERWLIFVMCYVSASGYYDYIFFTFVYGNVLVLLGDLSNSSTIYLLLLHPWIIVSSFFYRFVTKWVLCLWSPPSPPSLIRPPFFYSSSSLLVSFIVLLLFLPILGPHTLLGDPSSLPYRFPPLSTFIPYIFHIYLALLIPSLPSCPFLLHPLPPLLPLSPSLPSSVVLTSNTLPLFLIPQSLFLLYPFHFLKSLLVIFPSCLPSLHNPIVRSDT